MNIKKYFSALFGVAMLVSSCGVAIHTAHAEGVVREIKGAPYSPLQIAKATNRARTSRNLEPLTLSVALSNAAQLKAIDMAMNKYFSHVNPSGLQYSQFISSAGYAYKSAGENLAFQYKNTDALLKAWLKSSGHRANILGKQYTDIGVGIAYGERDGVRGWYVVQMFGSKEYNPIFSLR